MQDPEELTGIVFLNKVLEFINCCPNEKSWNYEGCESHRPYKVRLQQIEVLLQVFIKDNYFHNNLSYGIQSVLTGDFLNEKDLYSFTDLFQKMDRLSVSADYYMEKTEGWNIRNIKHHYSDLMKYKLLLNGVLNYNRGISEMSYPYLYSVMVIDNINKNIDAAVIDEYLSFVIDPKQNSYSKKSLIKKYGYPEEDVYMLDMDDF